ncbi:Sensor protein FixL [bacterium HR09]|nr:Sensor protein FixL [bacterium HR09]
MSKMHVMRKNDAVVPVDEEALQLLYDAVRCLPAGLIVVSEDGRIAFCNPLADAIRGVGERVGHPVAECHPPRALPALDKLLERFRHAPADRDHPLVVERGGKWEVLYQRITGEDGRFRGVVWLAHDISRHKLVQQQLLHHERMAGLGSMAARLAHDIKNPLNVIAGAAHNLKELVSDPVAREMVELIEGQVRRVGDLLSQLRELTRPLKPRFGQVAVNEFFSEYVGKQPPEVRERVELVPLAEELQARLDPDLLVRFLDNALANALHHSPTVVLSLGVATEPEGEWLSVTVRDFGPGFPQEVLDRLFEPFVSTRPDGLGLGLTIMREVCVLHGGDLQVANHPEGGALVTGRLATR